MKNSKIEYFITLLDVNYLPQLIALYDSLKTFEIEFHLIILCLDNELFKFIEKENFTNIYLLKLEDFENNQLKDKKKNRTKAEYCWTLTSWAIQWGLKMFPEAERITYLDCDLFFFKNPKIIFDEFDLSNKHVLITKHAYAPEYDQSLTSGKFCVQFLTIRRGLGEKVLHDWREKCMDWCFNFYEDGKYGDQKYLDAWPEKFSDLVHVLSQESSAQAPWNSLRFPYSDAIFYHFHGFKILSSNKFFLSTYLIPRPTYINIYLPYIASLKKIILKLKKNNYKIKKQHLIMRSFPLYYSLINKLRYIFRKYLIPNISIH